MLTILSIVIIIACVLLVLIVLVQNPKGGGLSAEFGSATQLGGVKRTTDFLEKATWTLAIAICLLAMVAAPYSKGRVSQSGPQTEVDASQATQDQQPSAPNQNNNIPSLPNQ